MDIPRQKPKVNRLPWIIGAAVILVAFDDVEAARIQRLRQRGRLRRLDAHVRQILSAEGSKRGAERDEQEQLFHPGTRWGSVEGRGQQGDTPILPQQRAFGRGAGKIPG